MYPARQEQCDKTVLPSGEEVNSGHETQEFESRPTTLLYFPAEQSVQRADPELSLYFPAGHATQITENAIEAAVKLSVKYQTDKKLPDKAIDLIDLACARYKLKDDFKGDKIVDEAEVQFELSKVLKIPT